MNTLPFRPFYHFCTVLDHHSKTEPFENWTCFHQMNTRLVQYSDGCFACNGLPFLFTFKIVFFQGSFASSTSKAEWRASTHSSSVTSSTATKWNLLTPPEHLTYQLPSQLSGVDQNPWTTLKTSTFSSTGRECYFKLVHNSHSLKDCVS